MIRLQHRVEIKYGHFVDVMKALEELKEVAQSRGWSEITAWVPLSGKGNEVVLMSEYDDYAAYKQQETEAYADPDFMTPWRRLGEHLVQGSIVFELFEPAPQLVEP